MRVGVIRGDMPGPVLLADLEPVSNFDASMEPQGQVRYVSRPTSTSVGAVLASSVAPAIVGTAITFNVTITGSNDTIQTRLASSGSFTSSVVAHATYTTIADLVKAVNAAFGASAAGVTASAGATLNTLRLASNTKGAGSILALNSVVGGSTFNTPADLGSGATTVTLPTAATIISAASPVSGPLNVSTGTITGISGLANASATEVSAIAQSIAPQFYETDAAIKSWLLGDLHGYRSSSYNPDPHRVPALSSAPAISVVQDDGSSAFTTTVPTVSGAVHNSPHTGDITISGTGLGNSEAFDATIIRVTNPTTGAYVRLQQSRIIKTLTGSTQGVVSATSIVIPASLLAGLGVVGSKVLVQYTSLASNVFTVT